MGSVKPVIVVVHATSKQGTSVVKSLLQSGRFAVKALVRDATTDSASRLMLPTRTGLNAPLRVVAVRGIRRLRSSTSAKQAAG